MFRKKKRNQIIDKAEQIIKDSGFAGVVEEDFKNVETTKDKQAFVIETLLYKYEHSSPKDQPALMNKLAEEIDNFSRMVYEAPEKLTPESLYRKVLSRARSKPADQSIDINGDIVRIKARECGEYFDGENFVPVVSVEILFNDECLYNDIPTQGIWSCATNYSELKMINTGMFDDPRDAFGYISYITSGY